MELVLNQLRSMTQRLGPGPQSVRLLDWFTAVERLAAAGKALVANRAAETNQWRQDGGRSPEHWLANRSGSTVGRRYRSADEAAPRPECVARGCDAHARLERDHRIDWAKTYVTRADDADLLCHFHHDLKTNHGWLLEPGIGKRQFLPPRTVSGPPLAAAGAKPP